MEGVGDIIGAGQLVSVFGHWSTFHDAEVVWLQLDRRPSDTGRPTLDALTHTFEVTSTIDADGYYALRRQVLVRLRFRDVAELRLEGFAHQNVLMGLILTDTRDPQPGQAGWEVVFDPASEFSASFRCQSVEVVSVVPCGKGGEPIQTAPESMS